jgi:hypothetical protein
MADAHAVGESQEGKAALAASLLMLGAMIIGIVEVIQRNSRLTSSRALIEIAVVLAISFTLGFAARFLMRAWSRWRSARTG